MRMAVRWEEYLNLHVSLLFLFIYTTLRFYLKQRIGQLMCFSLLAELKTTPRTNYARSGEGLGNNHTAGGQTMIWRSTWSKPAFKKVSWITLRVPVLRSAVYVSSARPLEYKVISFSSKPSML
jgi:hypothetical protein